MGQYRFAVMTALFAASLVVIGCSNSPDRPQADAPKVDSKPDEVAAERAKLSPGDLALVEAQEWCVISSDERLGSMGPPMKLDIKGQSVFICCKGCKKKAEAEPGKTLAKVEELKAKATAEKGAKN